MASHTFKWEPHLSSYFYFRIEWELPAGLVGTLSRCQAWSRLIENWLRDLEWKRNVHCEKKSHLQIPSFASLSWNFFPGSQEYTLVYWQKFLSSFPTMAVLCSLQIHSKLNGYQLTSMGGDLDRQLTYRELSFGKRSLPATGYLCLWGCFQRLPSLVKNFYISRKIKDFSWASCPNVTLWWKCFWLCFRLIKATN